MGNVGQIQAVGGESPALMTDENRRQLPPSPWFGEEVDGTGAVDLLWKAGIYGGP